MSRARHYPLLVALLLLSPLPSLGADGEIYNHDLVLAEKARGCPPASTEPKSNGEFCESLSYLRKNISPLPSLTSLFQEAPVVFFGDTHTNVTIKEWISRNLLNLKNAGFTHIALEALNSPSQPLLDRYKTDRQLRPEVVDLFRREWGWRPEEHTALVDAILKSGLKVVALDNREEIAAKPSGNEMLLRNEHMAGEISSILAHEPRARIAALTGRLHSRTRSSYAPVPSIPQLLERQGIKNLSFNLESGEETVANSFAQAYVAENLNGSYFLPTPREEALIDGIIFTQRGVVASADIKISEIEGWGANFHQLVNCRFLSDLPGSILCIADSGVHLRDMMGRMSYMAEGQNQDPVAINDKAFRLSRQARYAGHDIVSDDFHLFFAVTRKKCDRQNRLFCPTAYEEGLEDLVNHETKRRGLDRFVVIATTRANLADTISHELHHARYFLSPDYRLAVAQFWKEKVSPSDQQAIRQILEKTYNLGGEKGQELLLNEFQAYLLENDAENKLGAFREKYLDSLRRALLLKTTNFHLNSESRLYLRRIAFSRLFSPLTPVD